MRAVTASDGEFICVSDQSIVAAASRLATSTGVFAEAGAASAMLHAAMSGSTVEINRPGFIYSIFGYVRMA